MVFEFCGPFLTPLVQRCVPMLFELFGPFLTPWGKDVSVWYLSFVAHFKPHLCKDVFLCCLSFFGPFLTPWCKDVFLWCLSYLAHFLPHGARVFPYGA